MVNLWYKYRVFISVCLIIVIGLFPITIFFVVFLLFISQFFPPIVATKPYNRQSANIFMSATKKRAYLITPYWYELKEERMQLASNTCEVPTCKAKHNLSLHHTNYRNLGADTIEDVRIVCQPHHDMIHNELGYDRLTDYPISTATAVEIRNLLKGIK